MQRYSLFMKDKNIKAKKYNVYHLINYMILLKKMLKMI